MKKLLVNSGLVTALLFAAILLVSCSKKNELTKPSATIIETPKATSSTATVKGNIISQGNGTIIESGVCYAVTPSPDITKSKVINTEGNGKFNCILTGLLPNTMYYVRAYATNELGTAYGDEFPFMTAYVKFWVPDDNFRAALKKQFASSFDAYDSLKISDPNIKGFKGTLDLSNLTIASLTGIEYFPFLTSLTCSFNQLTKLDVSKNTALTMLICSSNLLTGLDLSKNSALNILDCDVNRLTSLDLSKNTKINLLFCSGNLLTSLDISSQTSFPDILSIIKDYVTLNNNGNTGLTTLKVNTAVQQNEEIVNVKNNVIGCVISTWSNGSLVCGNYNPNTNICQ